MTSPLQRVFNYQGNQVRTLIIDGKPWFVARDVCGILEIDNSQTRRLDDDEKGLRLIQTPGGTQEMTCVNEPGLYSLILGSRKPEARAFKRWVTPRGAAGHSPDRGIHIKRTIRYPPDLPRSPPLGRRPGREERKPQDRELPHETQGPAPRHVHERQEPPAQWASWPRPLGTGRNRLFDFLRERRVILPDSPVPYQRYIDCGYFTVKEKSVMVGDEVINRPQTFVTPRWRRLYRQG